MKRHSLLFALFIFLSSLSIQAEGTAGKWSERYNVTAITMDEGLPHNFVDDILKDSQGFLWIATRGEGIARYDGYEFTAFNMGSTHTKLRSNFINKLCEDNFKRIWAVSEMGITYWIYKPCRLYKSLIRKTNLFHCATAPPISFSIAKREIFGFVRKTIYSKLPLTNKEI